MYQKIREKVSENKDVILVGAIAVLTAVVIRSRPRCVIDVSVSKAAQELLVEFSDGSSNIYSLGKLLKD